MNITIKEIDHSRFIMHLMKELEKVAIYVGIPEDTTERKVKQKKDKEEKPSEMTNAMLLAIHTKGSPLNGLPARPVLEPAIEDPDNKKRINDHLLKAAILSVSGDVTGFRTEIEKAGMTAQNAARQWFVNPKNNWAPNTLSTVRRKLSRSKSKTAQEHLEEFYRRVEMGESMDGLDRPLIDTGQMRKSITYVIKDA